MGRRQGAGRRLGFKLPMVVPVAVLGAAGRDSVPVVAAAVGGAKKVLAAGTASRLAVVVSVVVQGKLKGGRAAMR